MLFPVIFLGRAAENNVGQEARVHDLRTMRRPNDQSCDLGGSTRKKAERGVCVHDRRKMSIHYAFSAVVWKDRLVEPLVIAFLAVQDSSISDNVGRSVCLSQLTIRA